MSMSRRYATITLLLFATAAFTRAQSFPLDDATDLTGTIRGALPRKGCVVELTSMQTYTFNKQTMCDADGSFRFTQVPRGVYSLVVRSGLQEQSEELSLMSTHEEIEVRLPAQPVSASNSISVSEMKVPDKAKNELHKAEHALANVNLKEADDHAKKALEIAPQFARALTLRAIVMIARNDLPHGLELANESAKLDPMVAMTQFVRASALNSMGRPKEAQMAAEQGLRLDGPWQGHFELARALMAQQQYQQALVEIDRATASNARVPGELTLLRAAVLIHLKDTNGAREALAAFMKKRPDDPRAAQLMSQINGR